jgi:hypothetical protein
MVIKYITNNLFDVFWKDGWENCVRVKKQEESFRIIRAFKKPPRDLQTFLKGAVK